MKDQTMRIICQECGREVPLREGRKIGFQVEESCPHCGATPLKRHIEVTLEDALDVIDKLETERSISPEEASDLKKLIRWIRDNIVKIKFDGIDLGFPQLISLRFKIKQQ